MNLGESWSQLGLDTVFRRVELETLIIMAVVDQGRCDNSNAYITAGK